MEKIEILKIFTQKCVIYFEIPSVHAFRLCGHQSFCENCFQPFRSSSGSFNFLVKRFETFAGRTLNRVEIENFFEITTDKRLISNHFSAGIKEKATAMVALIKTFSWCNDS